MMDKTNALLKAAAECILDEEGSFSVIINADMVDLPLEGTQMLTLGGKATPYLKLTEEGISAGLSINRFHYDAFIPWGAVSGVEGQNKVLYCEREDAGKGEEQVEKGIQGEKRHLSLVRD